MPDVTLTPVGGDPFNGGAQELDPGIHPPLTVAIPDAAAQPRPLTITRGPTPVEQNAATGDPTDYTPQRPLPGTEATLDQLGSGRAADGFADYAVANLPHTSSPVANYAMAAGVAPVMAGLHALDAYTGAARWAQDVQAGRYGTDVTDPASQAAVMPGALQTAMAMGAPGMGMAEENAAGIFGGRMSATANHAMADRAEQMLAQGARPADVWNETGWHRGVDGLMRYEIPDQGATFNPDSLGARAGEAVGAHPSMVFPRAMPAQQVIDHPELFAAYPELAQVPVAVGLMKDGSQGFYWPKGANGAQEHIGLSDGAGLPNLTMLHEMQHAVQAREGFEGGASSSAADFGAYRRNAGEVEARNVQSRSFNTLEQNARTPPSVTQDVSSGNQIVGNRVGVAASMDAEPDRYHLDASTLGDINELLGLGRDWKAPDPHAAMNDALRDFVPPQTQGYQRPPVAKALDPDSDAYNVFHGTGALQDFSRFDPTISGPNVSKHQQGALFFSPNPEEAGAYARMGMNDASDFQGTAGPRVIPASVDPGRTRLYDLGAMLDARDPRLMQGMRDVAGDAGHSPDSLGRMVDYEIQARAARAAAGQPDKGVPLALGAHNAAIGMARQDGLDTAILRGLAESNNGDQLAVLTPNRVSSAIDGRTLYARGLPGGSALAGQVPEAQPETQASMLARLLRQGGGT